MVQMMANPKVAVVTGSLSGIGREIALILAKNKFTTYASMRNLQKSSLLKSIVAAEEEEGGGGEEEEEEEDYYNRYDLLN
jgi:NAD(P)-dependent dehydrogenase (short-subunit alcohol dehydrogenase family)